MNMQWPVLSGALCFSNLANSTIQLSGWPLRRTISEAAFDWLAERSKTSDVSQAGHLD